MKGLFTCMITPMLIIELFEIFKGLWLVKFIVQHTKRYKFLDLPIVKVRGTKEVFKCLCFHCFSFSIKYINSSLQKGNLDRFKEKVPYQVDLLPEMNSVHLNWSKFEGIWRDAFMEHDVRSKGFCKLTYGE